MAREIERKFLVKGDSWRRSAEGVLYRQGYLSLAPERVVRVRTAGERGLLTVKGKGRGIVRPEYEYEIPPADAREMLEKLCIRPLVEKRRFRILHGGFWWEVDEFAGENEGLILAEVELQEEGEEVPLPDWIGEEVTGDNRYANTSLVEKPYRSWRNPPIR